MEQAILWLCDECRIYACNADLSAVDYHYSGEAAEKRARQIQDGAERLGWIQNHEAGAGVEHEVQRACDCCGARSFGTFYRFVRAAPMPVEVDTEVLPDGSVPIRLSRSVRVF